MFPFDLLLPAPWLQFTALIGVVVAVFVFRKPKNIFFQKPFAHDVRRARGPMERDQKQRALRLKQRFSASALPSDIDAVVIGSGPSGLTAAAILARTGRKVVVLDQHDQAGGCCHTFVEQGYEWDVGIHYVGRMQSDQLIRFLVDQLSEGQLGWEELDKDFDHVVLVNESGEKTIIPIWGDRQRLLDELIKRYPKHEKGLREFFAMTRSLWRNFFSLFPILKLMPPWLATLVVKLRIPALFSNKFFAYFHEETLATLFDRLFGEGEHEIKAVLNYIFGVYGVEPSRAGPGLLCVVYAHYTRGAYYPIGGASEVAYTFIPTIEKTGGRVLVNANVTEILLLEGKAVGVRVETSSGPVDVMAPLVISAAGVLNTFRRLLPKEIASHTTIGRLLDSGRIKPSFGSLQVFIGLKGSQEELQLPAKNLWIYYDTDVDKALAEWNNLDLDSAAEGGKVPFLFVGFPSAKDPTYNDRFPGRSACTVITASPMVWFRKWENEQVKKRGADYEAAKMRLARRCWDLVLDLYPQLADRMDYIDAGSPLSMAYYVNARDGETYGLDHDTERFAPDVVIALRPKVPEIGNLYLTGQDILTCGFAAGVFSGFVTCQAILKPLGECSNLINEAKQLQKKSDASKEKRCPCSDKQSCEKGQQTNEE